MSEIQTPSTAYVIEFDVFMKFFIPYWCVNAAAALNFSIPPLN